MFKTSTDRNVTQPKVLINFGPEGGISPDENHKNFPI